MGIREPSHGHDKSIEQRGQDHQEPKHPAKNGASASLAARAAIECTHHKASRVNEIHGSILESVFLVSPVRDASYQRTVRLSRLLPNARTETI